MALTIGARPDHGFNDPLGLLTDCHRRIEHFLSVMTRVAAEAGGGALSDEHRRALEACVQYFSNAAPRHTKDEEESLFPRLRQCGADIAVERLSALETEHVATDTALAGVLVSMRRWLEDGPISAGEAARLNEILTQLREVYARHIRVEESEVFPAAREALDADHLREIGQEMAARRGIAPKALDSIFI